MSLRSRPFERSLRRLVRHELRASRALWAEYKARRRRPTSGEQFLVPVLYLLLALMLFARASVVEDALGPETPAERLHLVLVVLALLATGLALVRARRFTGGLFWSSERVVLAHYPMSDESFFRFLWRQLVLSSLWSLGLFLATYVAIAAHRAGTYPQVAGAVGLAILQWGVTMALAILVARWAPRLPGDLIGSGFVLAAGVLAFWETPRSWFPRACAQVIPVTPAGWITQAFERGVLGGSAEGFLPLLAVVAIVLPAPWVLRWMRAVYSTADLEVLGATGTAESVVEQTLEQQVAEQTGQPLSGVEDAAFQAQLKDIAEDRLLALTERRVLSGAFLEPTPWERRGPMERVVAHCLSPRERVVAEFLTAGQPSWSRRWQIAAGIAVMVAAALLPWEKPSEGLVIWPAVVATALAVPVLGGGWAGFASVRCAEQFTPRFALVPVAYRELTSVLCVANGIRCLAWAPVAAGYGAFFASRFAGNPLAVAVLIVKGIGVILAAQPLLVAWRVTWEGSCNQHLTLRRLAFLLPFLLASVLFLAGAASFLVPRGRFVAAGAAGMVPTALAAWLLGGHLHNRRHTELVHAEQ